MRGRGKGSGREKVNTSTSEADPQSKDSTPEFEFESAGVLKRRCGSKVDENACNECTGGRTGA